MKMPKTAESLLPKIDSLYRYLYLVDVALQLLTHLLIALFFRLFLNSMTKLMLFNGMLKRFSLTQLAESECQASSGLSPPRLAGVPEISRSSREQEEWLGSSEVPRSTEVPEISGSAGISQSDK